MAMDPGAVGAGGDGDFPARGFRIFDQVRDAGQEGHFRHHLVKADQALFGEPVVIEGLAKQALEMAGRVKRTGAGTHGGAPHVHGEFGAVGGVDLVPGRVIGRFGIHDEPVEIEHQQLEIHVYLAWIGMEKAI
jgi:hypothetical protein